ncbi:hypothetical protein Tco_0781744 [Tanacetum coccineum]
MKIQELLHQTSYQMWQIISERWPDYINTPATKNRPAFYNNDDDDEEYTIVITPVLPTVECDNSLSIGDKHLSTIPEKEESSVEDLVPILNYEALFCDSEPDSRDFTVDVVEDIFNNPTREPRVHLPNVLPTYPTLHLDSDIPLSSDSLESDLVVSFPG